MIKFSVKIDMREVTRALSKAQREAVPNAAARATNRAIDAAKTTAMREISTATKLKQKDIRQRMIVRGASVSRLWASLEALPLSPNLQRFNARQNRTGVAATAWEGRKTYKHAFVMPNGGVVTRTTTKRFPLKGLRGPSLPASFVQDKIISHIAEVARDRWRSEFNRELSRRLGEISGSSIV